MVVEVELTPKQERELREIWDRVNAAAGLNKCGATFAQVYEGNAWRGPYMRVRFFSSEQYEQVSKAVKTPTTPHGFGIPAVNGTPAT